MHIKHNNLDPLSERGMNIGPQKNSHSSAIMVIKLMKLGFPLVGQPFFFELDSLVQYYLFLNMKKAWQERNSTQRRTELRKGMPILWDLTNPINRK